MPAGDTATFVYDIYVRTAPEEVFRGLIEPELTRRYWLHENVSDWRPGSRWEHRATGEEGKVDIAGEVVESDPPNRLVLTWAEPEHSGDPVKTSRVTFEVESGEELAGWPGGPWTHLRITHSELQPGSEMDRSIRFGWPAVASGLKTLLEWPGQEPAF